MKILKDYTPIILEEVLKSDEYMEDGEMIISSVNYSSNELIVNFNIFYGGSEKPKQQWQIIIKGIVSEKIVRDWTRFLNFYSEHYLLYEFTDQFAELYFNGKAKSPEKLFIDLYKSYLKNYHGGLLPFGLGINESMNIVKPCNNNMGLFARGSKKILEKYQEELSKNNIKSNFVYGTQPVIKDLKLLIFGESYFIGESFDFKLVD